MGKATNYRKIQYFHLFSFFLLRVEIIREVCRDLWPHSLNIPKFSISQKIS